MRGDDADAKTRGTAGPAGQIVRSFRPHYCGAIVLWPMSGEFYPVGYTATILGKYMSGIVR